MPRRHPAAQIHGDAAAQERELPTNTALRGVILQQCTDTRAKERFASVGSITAAPALENADGCGETRSHDSTFDQQQRRPERRHKVPRQRLHSRPLPSRALPSAGVRSSQARLLRRGRMKSLPSQLISPCPNNHFLAPLCYTHLPCCDTAIDRHQLLCWYSCSAQSPRAQNAVASIQPSLRAHPLPVFMPNTVTTNTLSPLLHRVLEPP